MRENLHRFFRAARGAGVRLSPAESIDAMRAVSKVGFADRTVLRQQHLRELAEPLGLLVAAAGVIRRIG